MDKCALITGGMGFIGSALAARLCGEGFQVTILDNLDPDGGGREFHVPAAASAVRGDVRDCELVKSLVRGVHAVFHLAGLSSHSGSMRDPLKDLDANSAGTLSVLEACRYANPSARIVFTSTRQVYGRIDSLPVSESHLVDPVDCNGVAKLAAEGYCSVYGRVHGIQAVILRLTNTYGPGMRIADARQMFLGLWIRRALAGESIEIFGDGRQRRDMVFVDDVVDALIAAAAARAPALIYNLGGVESVSLNHLADQLSQAACGLRIIKVPFPPDRKAIDIGDYHGDWSAIHQQLGWQPRISLADGLARTLAYYREHHGRYL